MRVFLILICVVVLGGMLCSCGRKSKPIAPKDSFYPHVYIIEE